MAMRKVVALVDDLFFQAKILETARHAGAEVRVVTSPETLAAAAHDAALVLVDLNARAQPLDAIAAVRRDGNPVPIVGFLSHVQTELAEQARAVGCTEVWPRSRFASRLPELLKQAES